jgi:hypothetical protein
MAVDESAKALRADAVHLAIALYFAGVRVALVSSHPLHRHSLFSPTQPPGPSAHPNHPPSSPQPPQLTSSHPHPTSILPHQVLDIKGEEPAAAAGSPLDIPELLRGYGQRFVRVDSEVGGCWIRGLMQFLVSPSDIVFLRKLSLTELC